MTNEIIQDGYISYVAMCNLHNVIKSIYAYNLMRDLRNMSVALQALGNAFRLYCFSTFVNYVSKYDDIVNEFPYLNEDEIIDIANILGIKPENAVLGYEDLGEKAEYIETFDYVEVMDAFDYMRNIAFNEFEYYELSRYGQDEGIAIYLYNIGEKALAFAYSTVINNSFDMFVRVLSKYDVINNIKNKNWTKFDIEQIYAYRNSLRLLQIDTSMKFLDEYDGFTINTIKSIIDIIERSNP